MASEIRRTENEFILQKRNEMIAKKVVQIAPGDAGKDVDLLFMCECSDLNCGEKIKVQVEEYQRVTKFEGQFLVYPLHEQLDIESVIGMSELYTIVEKRKDLVKAAA